MNVYTEERSVCLPGISPLLLQTHSPPLSLGCWPLWSSPTWLRYSLLLVIYDQRAALAGDQGMEESGTRLASGCPWPSLLLPVLRPRQRKSLWFCPRPAIKDLISIPKNCLLSCNISSVNPTLLNRFYGFSFNPKMAITVQYSGPTFVHFPTSSYLLLERCSLTSGLLTDQWQL